MLLRAGLHKNEELVFEGYKWFGNNRKITHRKAVCTCGGVGVLVKEPLLRFWSCEMFDDEVEDFLWVKFSSVVSELALLLAVYMLHPSYLIRERGVQ